MESNTSLSQVSQLLAAETPSTAQDEHFYRLALQIRHSLEHQHRWTKLQIHTMSPLTMKPMSRPLISGLPPRRLYVHPDEQIEILKKESEQKQAKEHGSHGSDGDDSELEPELEWVLPTHLREEWSLRKFSDVFDQIGSVPPSPEQDTETSQASQAPQSSKWRSTKRAVLGIVQDDGTIVFYFIHDGVVKPRQN